MRPQSLQATLSQARFHGLLDAFARQRLLVVGDLILDQYIWGVAERISPEAPVMVVEQQRTTYAAGGAANVAANVVAMGGQASLIGVVGKDAMADRLETVLTGAGVADIVLLSAAERPTTVKTRILAGDRQVLRVDREERQPIDPTAAARLLAEVDARLADTDVLLLSDYSKGVLTANLIERLVEQARARGKPVVANPKPANLPYYSGLDLVSLNQSEAETSTGIRIQGEDDLYRTGLELLRRTEGEAVLVTLGGRGLAVFLRAGTAHHVAAFTQEVFDVCGAGDSVIAAAALARASGGDWVEVATVANLAGNAKVRKRLVVPVTRRDLESVWAHALVNGEGGAAASVDTAAQPGEAAWNGYGGTSLK
ncbi:MAG: hypothetical protein HY320_05795 [Armatimonadetes bacterium]|nr:hypothetical protein [Armatimonadota bacterium]